MSEPLKACGVSRDTQSPGEKSVLVAFSRKLTDEELRALHEFLSGFGDAPDEPLPFLDFAPVLDDAASRILKQAAADNVNITEADANIYAAHTLDALDAEQVRIGIMQNDDIDDMPTFADEAIRKRLAS